MLYTIKIKYYLWARIIVNNRIYTNAYGIVKK